MRATSTLDTTKWAFGIAMWLLATLCARGQFADSYVSPNQGYLVQPYFFTPAYYAEHSRFEVSYLTPSGAYNDVNRMYAALMHRFNDQRAFGGMTTLERVSDFFFKTRVYLGYQESRQIGPDWRITFGAYGGVINYSLQGSGGSSGGSDLIGDANLGIYLTHPWVEGGMTIQQMTNGILQPIIAEFELARYQDYFVKGNIAMGPKVLWHPAGRILQFTNDVRLILSNLLVYDDLVGVGVNWFAEEGLSFLLHLKLPENEKPLRYGGFFSYYQPSASSLRGLNVRLYEFGLTLEFAR